MSASSVSAPAAESVVIVMPSNCIGIAPHEQAAATAAAAATNEYHVDLLGNSKATTTASLSDAESDDEQQQLERQMAAPGTVATATPANVPTLIGGRHNEYRSEYHGYSCFALLMMGLLIATAVVYYLSYHRYHNAEGNSCNAAGMNPFTIALVIFIFGCIIVGVAILSALVLSFHTANMIVSLSFLALLVLAILASVWLANAPGGPACNQSFVDLFTKGLILLWIVNGVSMCVGWYGNTVFKRAI